MKNVYAMIGTKKIVDGNKNLFQEVIKCIRGR